jgi:hypothetical protein
MERAFQILVPAILTIGLAGVTALAQAPAPEAQTIATTRQVQVKKGLVVYVSGNDLIVKGQDGTVKHYSVPPGTKFHVNGKDISASQLQPGTELTQTITTTTKDTVVTNVRNVDAKVVRVSPPYVTVTDADNVTKRVKVPDGTKFTVDGQQKTVFDLKPGMKLTGTVVTDTPQTVVSSTSKVSGTSKATAKVDTPVLMGVLLIEEE